jgi:peptidoglycan/xylan/chitin deacetylase (PgdA/CDA1 family)
MYTIKTPLLLKRIYPSLVWDIPVKEKVIYLTFDDGPVPEITPFVLHELKKAGAKATFFCIGDNVRKHPEEFREVVGAGHSIGNHTYNHLNGWHTSDKKYLDNIALCKPYFRTNLLRPPYGRIRSSQIRALKKEYHIIMWDILTGDFDPKLSPEACYRKVIAKTRPGSIVVFHDSIKAFPRLKYVLPKALENWTAAGYRFEAIPGEWTINS